jgi:hypothetical protein
VVSGARPRNSASRPGSAWRRARRWAKSGLATQRGRRLRGRKAATGWPSTVTTMSSPWATRRSSCRVVFRSSREATYRHATIVAHMRRVVGGDVARSRGEWFSCVRPLAMGRVGCGCPEGRSWLTVVEGGRASVAPFGSRRSGGGSAGQAAGRFGDYGWLMRAYVVPRIGAVRLDRLRPVGPTVAFATEPPLRADRGRRGTDGPWSFTISEE